MVRDDVHMLGTLAARGGQTLWDCPYYLTLAMPGHTGEPIAEWRDKVEAWEEGWLKESRFLTHADGLVQYVPTETFRTRH